MAVPAARVGVVHRSKANSIRVTKIVLFFFHGQRQRRLLPSMHHAERRKHAVEDDYMRTQRGTMDFCKDAFQELQHTRYILDQ